MINMFEKDISEQISISSTLNTEILLQIINQIRFDNIQNDNEIYRKPYSYSYGYKMYPLKSLYSCALVNKHWCSITIPILYKTMMSDIYDYKKPYINSKKLFEILLKFLDQEQIQELIDLGINIKEDFKEQGKRSTFDYPNFILKELHFSNLMRMIHEFINEHENELNNTFFVYQDKENNIKKYVVRVNINENSEENNNVNQTGETESTLYDTITIKDTIIACKPSKIRDKRLLSLLRRGAEGKISSNVKKKITNIRIEALLSSFLNMFIKYDVIIKKLSFSYLKTNKYDFLLKNEKMVELMGESVNEVNVEDYSGEIRSGLLLKVLEKKFKNLKSLNINSVNFSLAIRGGFYNELDRLIKSQPTLTSLHFTNMKFSRLVRTIFYISQQIRHLRFEGCKFTRTDRFDCIFSCDNLITLSFTRCKSIDYYIKKWTAMKSYHYVDKHGLIQDCSQLSKSVKKVKITDCKKNWKFSERKGENGEKIIIDNDYGNFVNWLQISEGFKEVEKYNIYTDFSTCKFCKIWRCEKLVKEFER